MRAFLQRNILVCAVLWTGAAQATMVERKPLHEIVAAADCIITGTVVKVDIVDSEGREIFEKNAHTGPGLTNTIRLHIRVDKDGIIKKSHGSLPSVIVVPLWQMWHYSVDQIREATLNSRSVFLLKGKDFQGAYLRDFQQPLSRRAEIEKLLREH